MDYSLTTVYVLPSDSVIMTAGGSEDLIAGQLGAYIDGFKTAIAPGTTFTKPFQLAQGRYPQDAITLGSKKSGQFTPMSITEMYSLEPFVSQNNSTVIEMTNFANLKCDEFYSFSLKASSFFTNIMYAGGKMDSVSAQTPCCDCGQDPCATLTDAQILEFLTELVELANSKWNQLVTVVLTGTTVADFKITITTLPLESYNTECVLFPNQMNDEMLIYPYFIKGPDSSQTPVGLVNRCDDGVELNVKERFKYSIGTADSVRAMEANYFTYQHWMKSKISQGSPEWRQHFTSFVEDGEDYQTFVLKGKNLSSNETWAGYVHTDQIAIVCIPVSNAAALGAFKTLIESLTGKLFDDVTA